MGADVLEEAARQLAAEGAARKAAEGRVAELQRQLAEREAVEASFRSAEGGGPEVDEAVPAVGAVEEVDGVSGDEAVDGEDGVDGGCGGAGRLFVLVSQLAEDGGLQHQVHWCL